MQKLLLTFLTVAIVAVAGSRAFAQQRVAPEKEALIKELLEVTGSTKSFKDVTSAMMSFQQKEAENTISSMIDDDKAFTAEEKTLMKQAALESLARMTKKLGDFFTNELDLAKLIDEIIVPLYDRNFSEAELRDLVAFYRTPTGQKTVSIMPKLVVETMAGFSEKVMPKLQEFIKKATDEEFAQIKQKVQQDKKAPPKPKAKS
jgi:hypothetical protein